MIFYLCIVKSHFISTLYGKGKGACHSFDKAYKVLSEQSDFYGFLIDFFCVATTKDVETKNEECEEERKNTTRKSLQDYSSHGSSAEGLVCFLALQCSF